MPWRIVERHIGRAGGLRERTARQREWDRKHGGELAGRLRHGRQLRPPGGSPGDHLLPQLRGPFRGPPGRPGPAGQVPGDVEVVYYPNNNALGVQYHPERLNPAHPCVVYYQQVVEEFLFPE